MPLNLTNTIQLVNIPPNLINFIYVSKLNTKIFAMSLFLQIIVQSSQSLSCLRSQRFPGGQQQAWRGPADCDLGSFLLCCTLNFLLPLHFSSMALRLIQ